MALAILAVIFRLHRPKPFRELLRLHGGCDDLLSSIDDLVKNWGLSDSMTCGDSVGLGVIEGSSDVGTLSQEPRHAQHCSQIRHCASLLLRHKNTLMEELRK